MRITDLAERLRRENARTRGGFLTRGDVVIHFARHQRLPPGYRVIWNDGYEHYMWIHASGSHGPIHVDKWTCRRNAIHHHKTNMTAPRREAHIAGPDCR
jgi:hypothetical protein